MRSTVLSFSFTAIFLLLGAGVASAQPGSFSLSNQAPYCDTAPPAGPAVRLNWTSSSGATSYDVYRNGSLYSSGITGTTFLNNANLNPGQTYTYFVRAKNSAGTRDSNTISVFIPDVCAGSTPPGSFSLSNQAPYCDTAPPAGPAVRLNWTSSSGATSYDVYRNGSLYSSGITGTSFLNNSNLTPGQTYTYFVRAKNSAGTRDSNTISVFVPDVCAGSTPPGSFSLSNQSPYCDTAPPAGPAVRLNWTSSSGATSYDVYRNGSLYSSGITGTSFLNNSNLTPGQTYTYFVRAKNSAGTRDSNTISVFIPDVCAGSSPPGSLSLSNEAVFCDTTPPAGPAVRLNWTSSSGATSYDLYRNGSLYSQNINGTTFLNNSNLTPGQTYTYFVRAKNSAGTRDSNTISVFIPDVCAGSSPPGSFSLSNEAVFCDTTPPAGPAVRLNWISSSGATSYDLYRNGSLYSQNINGTTFLNNINLTPGQTYTFFVRAKNSAGTRDSNTISVFIPDVCPGSNQPGPFSLSNETPFCDTAPPAGPAVRLNWSPSTGATSYDLYRNGGLYSSNITGTTFLNNVNLTPGQTYTFLVRAKNSSGTRDSNTISVFIPDVCESPACTLTCSASAPSQADQGSSVQFVANTTATGCSGSPSFSWSFGDGGGSSQQSPVHTYDASGTFFWTMTASVAGGQPCARSGAINVSGGTAECFSLSTQAQPAGGGTVLVQTGQNCPGGYTPGTGIQVSASPVAGYTFNNWTGSGGSLTNSTTASTVFTISGHAVLTANFRQSQEPQQKPTADFTFTPSSPRTGQAVSFRDASTGSPTAWAWDFDGNGSVDSTAQHPTYTYTRPGPYTVTLRTSNAYGDSLATKTLAVTAPAGMPRILRVVRQYPGFFLSGVRLANRFDVEVDWQGEPGSVRFSVSGDLGQTVSGTPSGASYTFRMGDFSPSISPSTITIVPTNREGIVGAAWEESIYVFPYPQWLEFALANDPGALQFASGQGQVTASLRFDFPEPHLAENGPIQLPNWIPYIGGKFGITETFARVEGTASSSGIGQFRLSGQTGFAAMGSTIEGAVSGSGQFRLLPPVGFSVPAASFDVNLTGTIAKEMGIVEAIPTLASLNAFPPVRWFNERATLRGEIKPTVRLAAHFAQNPTDGTLDFSEGLGTLGLDMTGSLRTCFFADHLCGRGWVTGGGQGTVGVPAPFVREGQISFEAGVEITADSFFRIGRTRAEFRASATYEAFCEWTANQGARCQSGGSASEQAVDAATLPSTAQIPVTLIERDYERFGEYSVFYEEPQFVAQPTSIGLPATLRSSIIATNVFPGASPELIEVGPARLLLWEQQDPGLPVPQSTDIAWSFFDGTHWSDPAVINHDTRAELSPVAGVDSAGRVVAAWLRIKDPVFNQSIDTVTDLPSFYRRLEVVTSMFDPRTQRWGPVSVVTENDSMDFNLRLSSDGAGKLFLTWLSNPAGEFLSTSTSPSSLQFSAWNGSAWSAPRAIAEGLVGVGSHAPAFRAKSGVILISRDPNASQTNDGVLDLYTWNGSRWSGLSTFAAGPIDNRLPTVAFDSLGEAQIVWLRGSNLVQASVSRPTPQVIRSGSTSMAFYGAQLLSSKRGPLILVWQEMADNGPANLFAMLYDARSRAWSLDRRLNQELLETHSFRGFFGSDGILRATYLATQISRTRSTIPIGQGTVTIENIPEDGQTDLRFLEYPLVVDLAVAGGGFTIHPAAPQPGETVNATLDLQNTGDFSVAGFTVRIYAGDPLRSGTQLASQRISGLRSGENRRLTFSLTYPQGARRLVAFIDADENVDELIETNNRASIDLGNNPPEARVTASVVGGTAPLTVQFDGSASTDPDGDPLSFAWAFTDGTPSGTGQTVFHTFAKPGTYPVTLAVTDTEGAVATTVVNIQVQPGTASCRVSTNNLCLNRNRFHVSVVWSDLGSNRSGAASAVAMTSDTGYFWFFDRNNVELVVKVIDGRGANGNFWVFYGALSSVEYTITVLDSQTGAVKTYHNPLGRLASQADTQAFRAGSSATLVEQASEPFADLSIFSPSLKASGSCASSSTVLCLSDRRFKVEVSFRNGGGSGNGRAIPLTNDTGYFWFFDRNNVELVIKVLDGQGLNGHFWLFYGALSNVEYTITVTDTQTGTRKTYRNPAGQLASVADTRAF